jgi:LL-diaminopimelate aminotransferase
MKAVAQRMDKLSTYFFSTLGRKIAELRAKGIDVIRLDVGSPDLPPPVSVIEALCRSARLSDRHGYQPHRGPLALRQAWAELYQSEFGVDLDPECEVIPLLGSKEGIFHLTMAIINPGDVVLVPDPGYPTYSRSVLFAGGQPFDLPLDARRDYLPELQAVPSEVGRRTRMMWLNYPNNPTSATAQMELFTEAVAFAQRYDLLLCHDAAYSLVTYEGYRAPSILQTPGAKEVAVEFNSLSKSCNMAGWRVGVVVGNREILDALYTLKTNIDSGHFLPVWEAAVVALKSDREWIDKRNETYRQRRDLVIHTLHNLGWSAAIPRASLYVWCPVPDGWSSIPFAFSLLEHAHVSLTPGIVFGKQGDGFVRISLTSPSDYIAEAMQRLETWWQGKPEHKALDSY